MPLRIYDSLTKQKKEFEPLEDNHVRMYNCGPTVYDYFHIGNARNFVTAGTICRYLEHKGYKITFVQNVTDIEDKIINRANEVGVEPSEIAEKYTEAFFEDLEKLRTRTPDISPRATEHIDDIVQFVQKLVEKGVAYEVDGDVYFEVTKFKGYGKLSGQKLEDVLHGARIEVDERKHYPADFNLWKKSKPGEIGWDSPWGAGRPGWHIECSVMSSKYLGESFDIHIGGNDLVFPHHENEIAQSEALTGKPLARFWVHNGMLQTTGEKMSKSLGNIRAIRDLLEDYEADVIRFYLLSAHYRKPLELGDNSLEEAKRALQHIRGSIVNVGMVAGEGKPILIDDLNARAKELYCNVEEALPKFEEAMDDDFNTPAAIGVIFELIAAANRFLADNSHNTRNIGLPTISVLGSVRSTVIKLCGILGMQVKGETHTSSISLEDKITVSDTVTVILIRGPLDKYPLDDLIRLDKEVGQDARERKDWTANDVIGSILKARQNAREEKDWAKADEIRDRLADLGIRLEDTDGGVTVTME